MKKCMLAFMFLLIVGIQMACESEVEPDLVTMPDVAGLSISEARLVIDGRFRIQEIITATNVHLPGRIVGYQGHEAGDMIERNSRVTVLVAEPPVGSYSLSNDILYVYDVGFVTGPNSPNFDMLMDAGIGGTDLGMPVRFGDEMILLYGDAFSGVGSHSGFWFSNFMARSNDFTLHDGLTFSSIVTNASGMARPFAQGAHNRNVSDEESTNPNREVTKIPTGGIAIGDDFYIFYMSVRYWGLPGQWLVTYNQVLKSSDNLASFQPVESLRWHEDEAPNFGQIFAVEDPEDDDILYILGIPGGRLGGTTLARVQKATFEDRDTYEYYLGNDTWLAGDAGLAALKANPHYIIQPPCSEMSVMYNPYLGKWMAVYLRYPDMVMVTADTITGPFTNRQTITNASLNPGLYGGLIHADYSDFDGQKFYMQISLWLPIYQVKLVEVVLK